MGTCVPTSVLGPLGVLTTTQRNLETIKLVTDATCPWNTADVVGRLSLASFPRLKNLSWKGLSSQGDIESLVEVLTERSDQLEELEIDLSHRYDAFRVHGGVGIFQLDAIAGGEFAAILNLSERETGTFSKLRKLTLSSVCLAAGNGQTTTLKRVHNSQKVFDFGSLTSLCLSDCPGWNLLLMVLTAGPQPIRLTRLEIQVRNSILSYNDTTIISHFLRAFRGLRELSVYTCDFVDATLLWKALAHHQATLTRFSHHKRRKLLT